ncbi:hypothetical protein [Methylophaga sp.]|uniref:hypothetical protein n=1 Tax=Methylophaga sp. TaxID=2024840 RepID=UPI003A938003
MINIKKLVALATLASVVISSGCASLGPNYQPKVSGYGYDAELYASLEPNGDDWSFRDFSPSGNKNERNVRLSDFRYLGSVKERRCLRGALGLTSGNCEKAFVFSKSKPSLVSPFFLPITALGVFFGEGSTRILPLMSYANFDWNEYWEAIESAQGNDSFTERYPALYDRYVHALNLNEKLRQIHEDREKFLIQDFKDRTHVGLKISPTSSFRPNKTIHALSDDDLQVRTNLSVSLDEIKKNLLSTNEVFRTLDDLEHRLTEVEHHAEAAQETINSSHLNVSFSMSRSFMSNLDEYLLGVIVPPEISWDENRKTPSKDTFKAMVMFKSESDIAKMNAAKQQAALLRQQQQAQRQTEKVAQLKSQIGSQFCSNGLITYSSYNCYNGICGNIDRKEAGQLIAYLEDFTGNGQRLKLRVLSWATDTGKTRHAPSSNILFKSNEGWKQNTTPGLIFWSDSDDWYRCNER